MKLFAESVLLSSGWQHNKTLIIEQGNIVDIVDGKLTGAECARGAVIPGMVNCHSHAFQRAFAGFSEQGSEGKDSFWTWRQVMYQFLSTLTVDDAEIIARHLYIEMLKAGYTRVAEFHYLHHQANGQPYDNLSAMSKALFEAAKTSGIGLTLLPVLYQYSGFGSLAPTDGQRRFINSTEQFNQLVTECVTLSTKYSNTNVGIAPHSLRATNQAGIEAAVVHVRSLDDKAPIHIHISEQQQEVNDCLAFTGERPVQWLLNNVDVDQYWCLIHATHINDSELQQMTEKAVVAGICPTTEANLGDGIFPTADFLANNGTLAIGSDSHISVNVVEELRWLEYAQRLSKQQRAVLADSNEMSVGRNLWQRAAKGGAQSTASNTGELAIGKQADLVVINPDITSLYASSDQHILDSVIFASRENPISDVMVAGVWQVWQGKHDSEVMAAHEFSALLNRQMR